MLTYTDRARPARQSALLPGPPGTVGAHPPRGLVRARARAHLAAPLPRAVRRARPARTPHERRRRAPGQRSRPPSCGASTAAATASPPSSPLASACWTWPAARASGCTCCARRARCPIGVDYDADALRDVRRTQPRRAWSTPTPRCLPLAERVDRPGRVVRDHRARARRARRWCSRFAACSKPGGRLVLSTPESRLRSARAAHRQPVPHPRIHRRRAARPAARSRSPRSSCTASDRRRPIATCRS